MKFCTKLLVGTLIAGFAPYKLEVKDNGDYVYKSLFLSVEKKTHETEDGDYRVKVFEEPAACRLSKKLIRAIKDHLPCKNADAEEAEEAEETAETEETEETEGSAPAETAEAEKAE